MAKHTWLRGAALVAIAAVAFTSLALAGCSKKDGSSGGSASNVKATPASEFSYELTEDKKGVVIKKYTGKGGKVAIPSVIKGMPVTEIGFRAFYDNKTITEIVVPANVTKTRLDAFYNSHNLTKVTLPDGLKEIGESTFWGCSKLTTVNLPASLESIAATAFYKCGELNNLIIPDSLSAVKFMREGKENPNNAAFADCGKLPLATRSRLEALGYKGKF